MDLFERASEAMSHPAIWMSADLLAMGAIAGAIGAMKEGNPTALGEFGAAAIALMGVGVGGELQFNTERATTQ